MSDEAPITITIKAGPGHDDPWHVLRANSVPEAERALEAVISSRIMELTLNASNLFKATKAIAPLTEPPVLSGGTATQAPQAAPVTPGPWPGSPAPAAPQANFQPAQPGAHPEGKQCNACGSVLVAATTRTGKGQWKCPQHRSTKNGDGSWGDNGHTMEWAR